MCVQKSLYIRLKYFYSYIEGWNPPANGVEKSLMTLVTHDTHDTPCRLLPCSHSGYNICALTTFFYLRGVEKIFSSPRRKIKPWEGIGHPRGFVTAERRLFCHLTYAEIYTEYQQLVINEITNSSKSLDKWNKLPFFVVPLHRSWEIAPRRGCGSLQAKHEACIKLYSLHFQCFTAQRFCFTKILGLKKAYHECYVSWVSLRNLGFIKPTEKSR